MKTHKTKIGQWVKYMGAAMDTRQAKITAQSKRADGEPMVTLFDPNMFDGMGCYCEPLAEVLVW